MLQKLAARNPLGLRLGFLVWKQALRSCDGGGPLPSSVLNKYVEWSECAWSVACAPGVSPSGQSDLQAGPLTPHRPGALRQQPRAGATPAPRPFSR